MVGFVMLFAGLCGTTAAAEPRVSTGAVGALAEMRAAEEMLATVSLRLGTLEQRFAGHAGAAGITDEALRADDTAELEFTQLEHDARQVFALLTALTGGPCFPASGIPAQAAIIGSNAKAAAARARGLALCLGSNRCPPRLTARAGGAAAALELVSAAGETLALHCPLEPAAKPGGALRPGK